MATTTNYGWTTPDDTALVKDGASAIRTLGSSVDTSVKSLNPGTTAGDVDYYTSATAKTRVAIGTTGQSLTVVGGVPAWAASPTSVLTTTGDTLYASAANTLARRAIGNTGDVLTVSGGLPTWAAPASGGITLIQSITASNQAIVQFNSIPQTYNHLLVIIQNGRPVTNAQDLNFRFNSDGTASRHTQSAFSATSASSTFGQTSVTIGSNLSSTGTQGLLQMMLYDYTNTSTWKMSVSTSGFPESTTPTSLSSMKTVGFYNQTSAITSLSFLMGSGNIQAGTFLLYGVK